MDGVSPHHPSWVLDTLVAPWPVNGLALLVKDAPVGSTVMIDELPPGK